MEEGRTGVRGMCNFFGGMCSLYVSERMCLGVRGDVQPFRGDMQGVQLFFRKVGGTALRTQ